MQIIEVAAHTRMLAPKQRITMRQVLAGVRLYRRIVVESFEQVTPAMKMNCEAYPAWKKVRYVQGNAVGIPQLHTLWYASSSTSFSES